MMISSLTVTLNRIN